MSEPIREFVDNRGVSLGVDAAVPGIVRGVKVLGFESRNGRTYKREAVERATSLYEGVQVNIDHSDDDRSYSDRFGKLQNVRVVADGLRGDLHFNPKHGLAEQFVWDAEHSPESVGMSHVAEVKTTRKDGKVVIESIERVLSVDLVADPATTASLFESKKEGDIMPLTIQQVREDRTIYDEIRTEVLAESAQSEDSKAKDKKLTEALAKVDVLEAEKSLRDQEAAILKELADAKLPSALVSEIFKKQLSLSDAETRKALIAERLELSKSITTKPSSKEQVVEGDAYAKDAKGFAGSFVV